MTNLFVGGRALVVNVFPACENQKYLDFFLR